MKFMKVRGNKKRRKVKVKAFLAAYIRSLTIHVSTISSSCLFIYIYLYKVVKILPHDID